MKYFTLVSLLIFSISCSSSEKAVNDVLEGAKENYLESNDIAISYSHLADLRTSLSDSYSHRENKIPESFDRVRVEEKVEQNLFEGYRVQIYSGQSVAFADSMAARFRVWADTTVANYQPETYVFFRPPFYRVHVGDFHQRTKAIRFSNMVQRYFKDAWVVYDQVNPSSVPADTVKIESKF